MKYKKIFSQCIACIVFTIIFPQAYASQDLISLFPLDHYSQNVSDWINPNDPNNNIPLLSADNQQNRLHEFKEHYVGSKSPWNSGYVNQVLHNADDIKSLEKSLIAYFSNQDKSENKIGYGENFRPHTKEWISQIADNMNIAQFNSLVYQESNRGIAIHNLHVRVLPTDDVHFYSHKIPGQGYPFDNLQMSSLWAGTPVYVLGESRDHEWLLVLSPAFIGWVHHQGIALADKAFINTWTEAANNKLVAITKTKTSMIDDSSHYLFPAYVGSVFPAVPGTDDFAVMVPGDAHNKAVIKHVKLTSNDAAYMPLAATPNHFAKIMQTMIGRPYGWGGMYFYNDCSAELKSLFTPFGIWLPRHSSDQVTEGKIVDKTSDTAENRLAYLKENGKAFLTIIYIGGHVALYIGERSSMAMTYQNVWGMHPRSEDGRVVIGQAVVFPMLLQFPENTDVVSQANKKYFRLGFLDQMSNSRQLLSREGLSVKAMLMPDAGE